jgi:ATP-dependent DNA helicase RecQ
VQEAFFRDEIKVVVATIAFGMGLNKANIRYVVHMNLPASLDGYTQEIGRAGRDGAMADCLLLHSPGDVVFQLILAGRVPEAHRGVKKGNIFGMHRFAIQIACRHRGIIRHFQAPCIDAADAVCGDRCDVCSGKRGQDLFAPMTTGTPIAWEPGSPFNNDLGAPKKTPALPMLRSVPEEEPDDFLLDFGLDSLI